MGSITRGIEAALFLSGAAAASADSATTATGVLTGAAAFGDFTSDTPGLRRHIRVGDIPPAFATRSIDNGPKQVARPPGAMPRAPAGFTVSVFAEGLSNPRVLTTAPNGDIFVVESGANRVSVLRDRAGRGVSEKTFKYADRLNQPFGLAFHPPTGPASHVYVANTDSVVRFPYAAGDTAATTEAQYVVTNLSGGGRLRGGGHWTRDVAFSADGSRMYVSVGSKSNVSDDEAEGRRARVFSYLPDGTDEKVFATGIRNPVGLAVHPATGDLWTSVNERDGMGDDLPSDYITRIREGQFYGWPWYYLGSNPDPRHKGAHPELAGKVAIPDVLVQAHSASLDLAFYDGKSFPAEYRGDGFAAEHGSWNRAKRTGYKVVRVPTRDGVPTGEYEDFLTGFVTPEGNVWGRPVGVTVAADGALLVSDDAGNRIWRVAYTGK